MTISVDIKMDPRINLKARRTLDGNILVLDHEDIDIVLMLEKGKCVTFPKENMSDKVYSAQDRMFRHLSKKGLISQSSVRGGNVFAQGNVVSNCGGHILAAKKNFDIPHPTKEGYRLRHTCPEGPSNDVYFRGRVTNKTEIILPNYWKKLVDFTTITVNLTPIGAHQNVIVKRIDEEKVYLQSKGGMPINCFFHIYGTRADGERLIPEYEGKTPADYPGNNDEYSVSGYHYDKREVES